MAEIHLDSLIWSPLRVWKTLVRDTGYLQGRGRQGPLHRDTSRVLYDTGEELMTNRLMSSHRTAVVGGD
jgi:hypothetical protein